MLLSLLRPHQRYAAARVGVAQRGISREEAASYIYALGLSQPPGYSHTVVASGSRLLTTAGAIPIDAEGNLVGPGDRYAQARQTLENLALALEAVGARERDIIKATIYMVAGEHADLGSVWNAAQESGIAGAASTLLGMSMLVLEGQLVEIEAHQERGEGSKAVTNNTPPCHGGALTP